MHYIANRVAICDVSHGELTKLLVGVASRMPVGGTTMTMVVFKPYKDS